MTWYPCDDCYNGDCSNCSVNDTQHDDDVVCPNCNDSPEGCEFCDPEPEIADSDLDVFEPYESHDYEDWGDDDWVEWDIFDCWAESQFIDD